MCVAMPLKTPHTFENNLFLFNSIIRFSGNAVDMLLTYQH